MLRGNAENARYAVVVVGFPRLVALFTDISFLYNNNDKNRTTIIMIEHSTRVFTEITKN